MRNQFENPFYERQEIIEAALKRSLEQLARDEIDPNNFRDLYGDTNVDTDLAEVQRLEQAIAREAISGDHESKKLAQVLEAMIHYHGEQSNWFGDDAETFKTSQFDDLKNGTDGVVEFVEENRASHLAFGIDATYGHYSDKKVGRILKRIKEGSIGRIKYFESDTTNFRGELTKVPLFVVAVNQQTVIEVAELWLDKENSKLAEHPIQMQILGELLEQAESFAEFARSVEQTDIARKYELIGEKIKRVIGEKQADGINELHDDLFFELRHTLEHEIDRFKD